jgi:hypothetical protein
VPRPSAKCNCLHCKKLFLPDYRNRGRQRFCAEPDCRRASERESQCRWLAKPANADYFRGPENSARVRAWRRQNPGYAKRPPKPAAPLQETCSAQPPLLQQVPAGRTLPPLQDLCRSQELLLVGLVSTFIDSPLQEDIAGHFRRLIARGRDILGHNAPQVPDSS